jgi:proteasome lid subunit RPN8/RPN11
MIENWTPDFFRQTNAVFTEQVIREACAHAAKSAQVETCGLVVDASYVACKNVATDPERNFEISPEAFEAAAALGKVRGVVHSHPGGPWVPSLADMQGQIETGLPWAVVVPGEDGGALACHWGGEKPPVFDQQENHIPRAFLHGASDCYELVRDYFQEVQGIALPPIARAWRWWKSPETYGEMYLDNLQAQGFRLITRDREEMKRIARTGDAYLTAYGSKTPNHAGVYLGDGLALDHVFRQLSKRKPIGPLFDNITHWLRHESKC